MQIDEAALSKFGKGEVAMVMRDDFESLASRFGYALAWDRKPAAALKADYERLASSPSKQNQAVGCPCGETLTTERHTPVFAIVECAIPLVEGAVVGMDLIVTSNGVEKDIAVEDVYGEVY